MEPSVTKSVVIQFLSDLPLSGMLGGPAFLLPSFAALEVALVTGALNDHAVPPTNYPF